MPENLPHTMSLPALLEWYHQMGVDEAVSNTPTNFYEWEAPPATNMGATPAATSPKAAPSPKAPPRTTQTPAPNNTSAAVIPADEAVAAAKATAQACTTIEALKDAVENFEGCSLRQGARHTVFYDGTTGGDLMVIGEAPGRDEDATGKPFVGRAGQLLDRMLAAIGHARTENTLITNVIFWRPPGNRTPTQVETAICRPFLDRLITLAAPKVILLAGGAPTSAMLGLTGIMRTRGKWQTISAGHAGAEQAIPTMPTLHPAFLLRQPEQKRLAWADLQRVQEKLTEH